MSEADQAIWRKRGEGFPIDENQEVQNSLFVNKQGHLNVFRA